MGLKERFMKVKSKGIDRLTKREIKRIEKDVRKQEQADERAADIQSRKTAISEARQLRREAVAKNIREKYGTYKPFSQKVSEIVKGFQDARTKKLSDQRQTQTYANRRTKKAKRVSRRQPDQVFGKNLLSSNQVTTGPSPGGVNFGFSGPNLGGGSLTRDIVTGKTIKRK